MARESGRQGITGPVPAGERAAGRAAQPAVREPPIVWRSHLPIAAPPRGRLPGGEGRAARTVRAERSEAPHPPRCRARAPLGPPQTTVRRRSLVRDWPPTFLR